MADPHLKEIRDVTPSAGGREDCLRTGGRRVQLRLCLVCGHVGCCDGSPNRPASRHFRTPPHPIVQSIEPGEDWRWCYVALARGAALGPSSTRAKRETDRMATQRRGSCRRPGRRGCEAHAA